MSFKAGSDDVRDTPAAKIIGELRKLGFEKIIAHDPVAMDELSKAYPTLGVEMKGNAKIVCEQADVIAITTAWDEYKELLGQCKKTVVDCRYFI